MKRKKFEMMTEDKFFRMNSVKKIKTLDTNPCFLEQGMEKFGLCFVKTNDYIMGLTDETKFSRFMIFNKRFELMNSILYTVIDCISKNCKGGKKDKLIDDFIDQIEKKSTKFINEITVSSAAYCSQISSGGFDNYESYLELIGERGNSDILSSIYEKWKVSVDNCNMKNFLIADGKLVSKKKSKNNQLFDGRDESDLKEESIQVEEDFI